MKIDNSGMFRTKHKHRPRPGWKLFILSSVFALTGWTLAASADGLQSVLAIQEAAHTFIARHLGNDYSSTDIQISELDSRLLLTQCNAALDTFMPPGGRLPGNTSIGVRCRTGKPWIIYIPVTVKAMRKVLVTQRPLSSGALITADDLRVEERDVTSGASEFVYKAADVIGKRATRALAAATALTPLMFKDPLLIRRGQQITLLIADSGIEVRMAGTALMDGAQGEVIRVRNSQSNRTIEGQVVETGIVKVHL